MAPGYALSGICNPMLGLGTLGLSTGGTYASYDPSMYGMYGASGLGYGYGNYADSIFNMYQTMQNTQQNMEISNANHISAMNSIMNQNEVTALGNSQSALVSKILQNGSVMTLVGNLIDKVHNGELDGVCNQYDDLKQQIYSTYRDEIIKRGDKENPDRTVREIIDILYSRKLQASGLQGTSLRDDIKNHGESALVNGFMQGSKSGHDKKYVEQALYHIYNEDISDSGSNETARSLGVVGGGTWKYAKYGAIAGGLTTGAVALTGGGAKLIESFIVTPARKIINKGANVESFINLGKICKGGLKAGILVATAIGIGGFFKSLYDGYKHKAQSAGT